LSESVVILMGLFVEKIVLPAVDKVPELILRLTPEVPVTVLPRVTLPVLFNEKVAPAEPDRKAKVPLLTTSTLPVPATAIRLETELFIELMLAFAFMAKLPALIVPEPVIEAPVKLTNDAPALMDDVEIAPLGAPNVKAPRTTPEFTCVPGTNPTLLTPFSETGPATTPVVSILPALIPLPNSETLPPAEPELLVLISPIEIEPFATANIPPPPLGPFALKFTSGILIEPDEALCRT
jgi:hypothetical protein